MYGECSGYHFDSASKTRVLSLFVHSVLQINPNHFAASKNESYAYSFCHLLHALCSEGEGGWGLCC